jgi:hypothetical protein
MNIDIDKLLKEYNLANCKTEQEKEFAKQVAAFRKTSLEVLQAEIEAVIKKYAKIEAVRLIL